MSCTNTCHNYVQSKSALRIAVGCVDGDDGQGAITSDCEEKPLKRHFGPVQKVDLGEYTIRNSNQATTQTDDLLVYPERIAGAFKVFRAFKAAGSDGPYPAIIKPPEIIIA
ncbi:hypothetical protein FGIG_01749 [Fasciola gigantica]|uniref:Uncharacterized protein n=1 Tax=Fasciola gigantica TaxID=46835 RepID=A0A504YEU4_FASGI|nr:hypothetical protein FGIG_01749 [Fasciola gigantica]